VGKVDPGGQDPPFGQTPPEVGDMSLASLWGGESAHSLGKVRGPGAGRERKIRFSMIPALPRPGPYQTGVTLASRGDVPSCITAHIVQ